MLKALRRSFLDTRVEKRRLEAWAVFEAQAGKGPLMARDLAARRRRNSGSQRGPHSRGASRNTSKVQAEVQGATSKHCTGSGHLAVVPEKFLAPRGKRVLVGLAANVEIPGERSGRRGALPMGLTKGGRPNACDRRETLPFVFPR